MSSVQIKMIIGKYAKVVKALGFHPNFIPVAGKSVEREVFIKQVNADSVRTKLFSSAENKAAHLAKLDVIPSGDLFYAQGDFTGEIFTSNAYVAFALDKCEKDQDGYWMEDASIRHCKKRFCVSYLDDSGVPCGFAIEYVCDDRCIPKTYRFNLAIIRNTTASPGEREVTFISHQDILRPDIRKNLAKVSIEKIPAIVKEKLHSEALAVFINGLFKPIQSAFQYCDVLNSSCFSGFSFDHQKAKRAHQLFMFDLYLSEILDKAYDFKKAGEIKGYKAAVNLYAVLTDYKKKMLDGEITMEAFRKNCEQTLQAAQQGELKHHRGIFGKLWHQILVLLNTFTRGYVEIRETDSLFKMTKIKQALNDVTSGPNAQSKNR